MLARFQAGLLVQKLKVRGFGDCGCGCFVVVEHNEEEFPVAGDDDL